MTEARTHTINGIEFTEGEAIEARWGGEWEAATLEGKARTGDDYWCVRYADDRCDSSRWSSEIRKLVPTDRARLDALYEAARAHHDFWKGGGTCGHGRHEASPLLQTLCDLLTAETKLRGDGA